MKSETRTKPSRSINLFLSILVLPAGIFLADVIAMVLVAFFDGPYAVVIFLCAIITTVLVFPLIYKLSYRPMLNHISALERTDSILQARLRLMQFAAALTTEELLGEALDEFEALTGSTVSFFHYLEADQKTVRLKAWSKNTLDNLCKAEGKDSHYSVEKAGVWADCVTLRQPVIHNDYASLAHRKGLPVGHAPIVRELTVPILRDDRIVAITGVGNKPEKYTQEDLELVSTLADFVWDIIERKKSETALRESEEKFRTLVDWTYDWELWVDQHGIIVYTSPSCERITGYRPEEFISDTELLVNIVHPDDRQSYEEHKLLVHDETAGINNVEYRINALDGSEHWIDHICRPLFREDGSYLGRRISNRDITARKLAEQEIRERNKKENILTHTIHTMQIEIARDLHDTVGQNIGYLRMKLDHLAEKGVHDPQALKAELENMLKVADESYDLIRGKLDTLQAGDLTDPISSFTQYASKVEARSAFKINLSTQGDARPLAPNQVRQLFFVFREALSNIEKYANASLVDVRLTWNEDDLTLVIADNGHGFDLEDLDLCNRYGLRFMRERIESLNGVFEVQSANKAGTTVEISLPYKQKMIQPVEINTGN